MTPTAAHLDDFDAKTTATPLLCEAAFYRRLYPASGGSSTISAFNLAVTTTTSISTKTTTTLAIEVDHYGKRGSVYQTKSMLQLSTPRRRE